MPTLSIITCVLPSKSEHIIDAWNSILAQKLPRNWSFEWHIQVDGPEKIFFVQDDDPRIKTSYNLRRMGPAISRNTALARAKGKLIKILDADDQLTNDQLAREIDVFEHNNNIGFVVSEALDYFSDGSLQSKSTAPPNGLIERGTLPKSWRNNDYRLTVHPATLTVRAELMHALGGWMGIATSEDTGLLMALNVVSKGFYLNRPGLIYRKWDNQLSTTIEHVDEYARTARHQAIEHRINALYDWGIQWPSL